jgi:1-phosphofructokinase/tagatose 6-phosphate kinase
MGKFLTVSLNPALQKTLRFSAIIPNSVNRTGIHHLDVAGKGINVSRVIRQLGKDLVHLTQLGGPMRPLFLSLCEQDAISVEWVESGSPIRLCYTLINDADSSVTELVEESAPVIADTEERLLERFEKLLPDCKCLIVSGTKASGFSDNVIPFMANKAKASGLTTILDLRGKDLIGSLAFEPDIIKPNLYEFAETFTPDLLECIENPDNEKTVKNRIREAMLELCQKYHCHIVLTRGAHQIWAAETDNFFQVDFTPVKPLNTTGSGDAFTAGLACALGDGASFAEAIAEGARCGALNALCFRPGVIR